MVEDTDGPEDPRNAIGELLALKLVVAIMLRSSPEREEVMSLLRALEARQEPADDPLRTRPALSDLLNFFDRIADTD